MLTAEWRCQCHTVCTSHPEGGYKSLCWLYMMIHLDYYENLPHFLFVRSAAYLRGNQPHGASSASTVHCLCSRSDYNLCWLDCPQSHSDKPGLMDADKMVWFCTFIVWKHRCVMYMCMTITEWGRARGCLTAETISKLWKRPCFIGSDVCGFVWVSVCVCGLSADQNSSTAFGI